MSITTKDKRTALKVLPKDLANHLFFQARNLAIEALLLRLENQLLREGFPVTCHWQESSFSAPIVQIRMANTGKGAWEYGSCRLVIKREKITDGAELLPCFYSLEKVDTAEYWAGKEPKLLREFRVRIEALGANHFASEIEKLNYPFDYTSYSAF